MAHFMVFGLAEFMVFLMAPFHSPALSIDKALLHALLQAVHRVCKRAEHEPNAGQVRLGLAAIAEHFIEVLRTAQ